MEMYHEVFYNNNIYNTNNECLGLLSRGSEAGGDSVKILASLLGENSSFAVWVLLNPLDLLELLNSLSEAVSS